MKEITTFCKILHPGAGNKSFLVLMLSINEQGEGVSAYGRDCMGSDRDGVHFHHSVVFCSSSQISVDTSPTFWLLLTQNQGCLLSPFLPPSPPHPQKTVGWGQARAQGDITGAANLNSPKRYSILYNAMLCNKSWGSESRRVCVCVSLVMEVSLSRQLLHVLRPLFPRSGRTSLCHRNQRLIFSPFGSVKSFFFQVE